MNIPDDGPQHGGLIDAHLFLTLFVFLFPIFSTMTILRYHLSYWIFVPCAIVWYMVYQIEYGGFR